MANVRINETAAKTLPAPAKGAKLYYDDALTRLALRVTANGARAFVINYRVGGRERRATIGSYPAWSAAKAREAAKEMLRQIDLGIDPLGVKEEAAAAKAADDASPTVATLLDRFADSELSKKRESTRREYERQIAQLKDPRPRTIKGKEGVPPSDIEKRFGSIKLKDVSYSDVSALHDAVSKRAPIVANRLMALLSRAFNLGMKWKLIGHNPAQGISRNYEQGRERFLTLDEIKRVFTALDAYEDEIVANAIRLLILVGSRRGETFAAKWTDIDLAKGTWTKPASSTKSKKVHRVFLPAQAVQMLQAMREADPKGTFVFPSNGESGHLIDVKKGWEIIRNKAEIGECRLHDLRHSYASLLAGKGKSLLEIGKHLGHASPSTTARYTHLVEDAMRDTVAELSADLPAFVPKDKKKLIIKKTKQKV